MKRGEIWATIRAERERLAGVLRGLEPDQWDHPSLCGGWRVRHVVGHLIGLYEQWERWTPFLAGALRHGFRLNAFWDADARARGEAPPDRLLAAFEAGIGHRRHFWPTYALLETVVHGQDVRRPLGIDHGIPPEVFRPVADLLRRQGYPYGVRRRIRGLRLEATDLDWVTGEGLVVRAPMEELVLGMAGRLDLRAATTAR